MRFPVLSMLLVMLPAVSAQWTSDVLQNTSVRSGTGIEATTPLMADRSDGSTYVSWFDAQPGGYELRLQLLDADGYPQWDPAGLLVSDHPQSSALFRYDLQVDGQGNAVVAFQDERTGQLDIVVYKVAPSGAMLWGVDGVELTDVGATQGLAPVVVVLADQHVVIAWNANDGGSSRWVPFQLLDEQGVPLWTVPQRVPGTANHTRPQLVGTLDGFLLQYVEETGNFPFTNTLYVQRYDAMGGAVWNQPTQISTKTISFFDFPKPVRDGNNGLYLAFNTSNPLAPSLSDVYVQRVFSMGSLWSATGTQAITGTTTQRFTTGMCLINWIMGTMVPIQVTNTGQTSGGWSVQGLDTNGVVRLGTMGVEIVPSGPELARPVGVASTGDGILVVHEMGGFGQQHLRATRVGVGGNEVWTSPVDLCVVNSNKDDVTCGRLWNNGQLVTVWQDDRLGSGIFAQNIFSDGDLGLTTGIGDATSIDGSIRLLENPTSRPAVLFSSDHTGLFTISVLDVLGRPLTQERISVTGGIHDLPSVDGVASGQYVIRVSGPTGSRILRWLKP